MKRLFVILHKSLGGGGGNELTVCPVLSEFICQYAHACGQ